MSSKTRWCVVTNHGNLGVFPYDQLDDMNKYIEYLKNISDVNFIDIYVFQYRIEKKVEWKNV